MNENKKKIIDEAIENIDEKYINETAETMKKHSGRQIEFTEVVVEKPVPDKNAGFKRAVKISLSSAAALAAVVGGGYMLRNVDLREEPPVNPSVSDTSVSTGITTYDPIEPSASTDITTVNPNESEFVLPDGEYVHQSSEFSYSRVDMYYYRETEKAVIQFFNFMEDRVVYQLELDLKGSNIDDAEPKITACDFFSGSVLVLFIPQKAEAGGIDYRLQLIRFNENTAYTITTSDNSDILADNNFYFTYDYDMEAFRVRHNGKTTSYKIDIANDTVIKTELFPLDNDNTPSEPEGLEFSRGTQIFEDVFYGLWECTYGGTADTDRTEELDLKFSYYGDASFGSWGNYDSRIAEDENGWYISGINGGEGVLHYVPKDDPKTMYCLPCAIEPSWPKSEYFKVYKKVVGGNNFVIEGGSLTYRGVWKFEEQTGLNIADMGDVVTDDSGKQWQSWYNLGKYGTGQIILNPYNPADNRISWSLLYCDAEFDTINYQATDEEPPVSYLTFTADKINGKWEVTSIVPTPEIPVTEDTNVLNISDLRMLSNNSEIFEDIFYGRWTNQNHHMLEFEFAYTGDASAEYSSRYTDYVSEDAQGWYMTGTAGGLGTLMFVPRDNPEIMYYYNDFGETVNMNDYNGIFYKEPTEYTTEISNGCSLSKRGIDRIHELIGYHIGLTPQEVVDKNGKKWQKWYDREKMNEGKTYLKKYSENEIEYSLLYGDGEFDLPSFDTSEGYPEICYLSFRAEKINGEWQITEISRYDERLESLMVDGMYSEYANIVKEKSEMLNQTVSDPANLSNIIIDVEYFPLNDGHYYALRSIRTSWQLGPEHYELYYYNGYQYQLVTSQIGYIEATAIDNVLYTFTQDNMGVHILSFKDGKAFQTQRVVNMSDLYTIFDISALHIGDYHLVTVTEYTDSADNPQIYEYIFTNTPLVNFGINDEGTELTIDADKKGFSAVIDGEKIYYRADSMKLEDSLWHLTTHGENIWSAAMIGDNYPDYSSDTIRGSSGYELGYLCNYYEFYEYISGIYNYECHIDIRENSNAEYTSNLGKIYCNEGARGANINVGKITYEIQNNFGTRAEILCTAYRCDENGITTDEVYESYIIPAERDENGWHLAKFYSPR